VPRVKTLNVRDFGAKGNGKSDDTKAIQKALNAAGKTEGTVYVPAGVYLCGELQVPAGVGMHGHPTWSWRQSHGAILRLKDSSAACLLNLNGAFGATIYGLCLQGLGPKTEKPIHGIMVDKPDYGTQEDTPRIDACRVENFSGDGIRLERIWCFMVRHSQSYHNAGCGLRVRGWDGFVLDNWLSGNGQAGYGAYDQSASNTLTGNRIEWNRQGGIVIRNGSTYNITGNYIDRAGRCGIALLPDKEKYCHTLTLTGNVIYRSGKPDWGKGDEFDSAHVRFEGVRGMVFSGNAMTAGPDDGLKGQWSPDYGIVLRGLENSIIKDNVMHQGAMKELVVDRGGHGPNVVVKDNVGSLKKL
jgi:parallel beta-helix repeat protein